MTIYFAQLAITNDAAGRPFIVKVYRAASALATGDVTVCTCLKPLPAYERLTTSLPLNTWIWDGRQISPCFATMQAAKLVAINADYNAARAAGITVSGITLPAEDSDLNTFTQLIALLSAAEALLPTSEQAAFEASPQIVADAAGTPHTMTVTQVRVLLVQYGQAVQALWTTAATRRAAVATATSLTALAAI